MLNTWFSKIAIHNTIPPDATKKTLYSWGTMDICMLIKIPWKAILGNLKRFWELNYFSWDLLWFDSRNAGCHAECKLNKNEEKSTEGGELVLVNTRRIWISKKTWSLKPFLCFVLSDVVQVTSPYGGGRGGPISLVFRRGKRDQWDVVPKGKSIHANAPKTYSSLDQPTTALHINTFSNRDREWRRLPSPPLLSLPLLVICVSVVLHPPLLSILFNLWRNVLSVKRRASELVLAVSFLLLSVRPWPMSQRTKDSNPARPWIADPKLVFISDIGLYFNVTL